MAQENYPIQFTDERYLTREEVRSTMGSWLIDDVWRDILAYRSKHAERFDLVNIENAPYSFTYTDAIQAKLRVVEAKASKVIATLSNLLNKKERPQALKAAYLPLLKAVGRLEKSSISELSIKALLNGTYGEKDPGHDAVIAYKEILDSLYSDARMNAPDDNFLAFALGRLLHQDDLVEFYRYENFDANMAYNRYRYLNNHNFPYAPADEVDRLMASLMAFVSSRDVAPLVKALVALFYIDHIKPFKERNASLAALFAKAVYGYFEEEPLVFLLPFEGLLEESPRLTSANYQSQKDGDITYVVLYFAERLGLALDNLSKELEAIRIASYTPEYEPSPVEQRSIAEAVESKPTQMSLFEEPAPMAKEPAPEPEPEPEPEPVKESTPVESSLFIPDWQAIEREGKKREQEERAKREAEASAPAPQPIPEPVKEPAPAVKALEEAVMEAPEPRVLYEPSALSPAEVKEYVQYLLETNPRLNKKQATFLANHCTKNRFYTIQDYKKAMRVAYETARTSMDTLAHEGYYDKLAVKNKFVYTPKK